MPHRLFYGWWIALATVAVYAIGGGFTFYGLTVYFAGFEREFGWSRTELSGAISISFLITGLLGSVAGRLADTHSARGVILAGIIVAGLSFVFLTTTNTVWQLYLAYVFLAVGRTGVNFVPLATGIANWFVRKRGLAMAIMRLGAGLGSFVFAPFADYLITSFGLVQAFWIIAIILIVILAPVTLVIRQRPADMGLLPDGATSASSAVNDRTANASADRGEQRGISLSEALRVPGFWLLAASIGLFFAGEVTVLMHAVPYFQDRGFSSADATRIMGFAALVGMGSTLVIGQMADKVLSGKYLMSICFALQSVSLALLWFAHSTPVVIAFVIVFGISANGILALQAIVVGEVFGVRSYGAIFGVLSAITNFGTILGPVFAGYIFDTRGSYLTAFVMFIVVDLCAALLVLFLRPLQETMARLGLRQSAVTQN